MKNYEYTDKDWENDAPAIPDNHTIDYLASLEKAVGKDSIVQEHKLKEEKPN